MELGKVNPFDPTTDTYKQLENKFNPEKSGDEPVKFTQSEEGGIANKYLDTENDFLDAFESYENSKDSVKTAREKWKKAKAEGADKETITKLKDELNNAKSLRKTAKTNYNTANKNYKEAHKGQETSELRNSGYFINKDFGTVQSQNTELAKNHLGENSIPLRPDQTLELLKETGFDTEGLNTEMAEDGTVSFAKGNQSIKAFFNQDTGEVHIMRTTKSGKNAGKVEISTFENKDGKYRTDIYGSDNPNEI